MKTINISDFIVPEDFPIIEAINVIDRNCKGIVFICDNDILLATLTDGDVRRHILSGKSLTAPVSEAANYNFHSLPADIDYTEAKIFCDQFQINVIPGIDKNGKVVTFFSRNEEIELPFGRLNVPVVIMAGGKGTRLYPYTKILPKSLIPIGELTITEHIIGEFKKFGCEKFTMIVNHKKEMVKAYFSEIGAMMFSVDFLDESESLGTGGGLSLLRSRVTGTFFLSNCDILVYGDYKNMIDQHKALGNLLTMVCATKTFSFPYGTVDVGLDGNIKSLQEKPSYSFLTNTGFYIIESGFLKHVPDNTFIHITDIIQNCINRGEKIGVYPIGEDQWLDMGNHDDMEKMINKIKGKKFSNTY